jgi:hypothetical protein
LGADRHRARFPALIGAGGEFITLPSRFYHVGGVAGGIGIGDFSRAARGHLLRGERRHMMTTKLALLAAATMLAAFPMGAAAGVLPFTATQLNYSPAGDPAGRCAPAVTINFINSGPFFVSGTSSLGNYIADGSHCIVPPNILDGETRLMFANGTLFATYSGTVTPLSPTSFQPNQLFTVMGGTGFFADATGSWTQTGIVVRAADGTTTGDVTLDGFIVTPAPSMLALFGLSLGGLAAVRRRMARMR